MKEDNTHDLISRIIFYSCLIDFNLYMDNSVIFHQDRIRHHHPKSSWVRIDFKTGPKSTSTLTGSDLVGLAIIQSQRSWGQTLVLGVVCLTQPSKIEWLHGRGQQRLTNNNNNTNSIHEALSLISCSIQWWMISYSNLLPHMRLSSNG